MAKKTIILLTLLCVGLEARAADLANPRPIPFWGGNEIQGLTFKDDYRSLDVSMPLPTIPYFPKLSYHRQAFEAKSQIGGWQSGGAHSIKAHLPFGLTFEAGNRLDKFGSRDSEFVGINFSYSNLGNHDSNKFFSRNNSKRMAVQPEGLASQEGGGRFWSIVGPLAIGATIGYLMEDDRPSVTRTNQSNYSPNNNGQNPSDGNSSSSGPTAQWNMIWNDEFNSNQLNEEKWSSTDSYSRDPCFGGGNNEQQCYTSHNSSSQNISFSEGKLVLTARQESGLGWGRTYTSGRIQSNGKGDFTYGRFEASIKLPTGQGSWPAFWMLPSINSVDWPSRGEIDIMEAINLGSSGSGTIHGTAHFGDPHTYIGGSSIINDVNAFNTYAVEWYPDEIRWFLNGNQYYQLAEDRYFSSDFPGDPNAPFDQDFHLILNFAVGGQWPGNSDGQNFPRQMEVDYVRVYECSGNDYSDCKQ